MNVTRIAAAAAMAGALGLGVVGIGSGVAQADPHGPGPFPPIPPIPGPPGHNPYGPPGQVMKGNPVVPGLTGVPPGHWNDPAWAGLPVVWAPADWIQLGIPGPQPVVFNAELNVWGIWWNSQFIALR